MTILRPANVRVEVPPLPEALQDFRNWLYLVWQHIQLPAPTWVQYDVASFLQHGPKREIIMGFRGVGKSFITGAFATWVLRMWPQAKIMVVSAAKDRADAFSVFVKRLIMEMPALECLRPREDQRFSNVAFDVGPAIADQSPSVKSVGITGAITGSRADLIIADDVENINNSATQEQRFQIAERVKEFDAVLKPGGRIVYLGTPQTEFSLYKTLEDRGYTPRIWPALYPDENLRYIYASRLAPIIADKLDADPTLAGKPIDPKRFSEIDLLERQTSYGRSGFALQFMLDTSLSDALRYPLKLSDLIISNVDPDFAPAKTVYASDTEHLIKDIPNVGLNGDRLYWAMDTIKPMAPYDGAVMAIDPSGRGKDETGYAVVKIRHGQLYLTASGGLQGGYTPDNLKALAVIAKEQKVNKVIIEDNFGDGMFAALLKPILEKIYAVSVEDTHSTGQKELRIVGDLEPVLNQHKLVVDRSILVRDREQQPDPLKQLFYQLTRITKDRRSLKHEDRLEALAMAVKYFQEQLEVEVDKALEEEEARLLDEELDRFIDLCQSSPGSSRSESDQGYKDSWLKSTLGRFSQ